MFATIFQILFAVYALSVIGTGVYLVVYSNAFTKPVPQYIARFRPNHPTGVYWEDAWLGVVVALVPVFNTLLTGFTLNLMFSAFIRWIGLSPIHSFDE